jgi:hypothetical protein
MSAEIGSRLTDELAADLARPARSRDQALLLATVDPGGAPRMALLSRAEVHVAGTDRLLLAMWSGSRSATNVERAGSATLLWVVGAAAVSVTMRCAGRTDLGEPDRPGERALVALTMLVDGVRVDEAPYAELVSPLTFQLYEPNDVLPRWDDVARRLAEVRRPDVPEP